MLLASTSCFKGYGLHKAFELIKSSGYDGADLVLSGGDYDSENADYVSEIVSLTGVPVVSITAYERKMDTKTVDRLIEMAKKLDAKLVNIFPPHRLDKDGTWFSDYLPLVKKQNPDISIAIINVEPKTFLFFIPEYKDATLSSIKKITGETALHVSNVNPESGVDLIKTFTVLGSSIVNVFLSDKTGTKEAMLPGKGEMPLETLLIRLKEGGYKRYFTLKVGPKDLGAGNDETVLKRMEEARKFFKKHY